MLGSGAGWADTVTLTMRFLPGLFYQKSEPLKSRRGNVIKQIMNNSVVLCQNGLKVNVPVEYQPHKCIN